MSLISTVFPWRQRLCNFQEERVLFAAAPVALTMSASLATISFIKIRTRSMEQFRLLMASQHVHPAGSTGYKAWWLLYLFDNLIASIVLSLWFFYRFDDAILVFSPFQVPSRKIAALGAAENWLYSTPNANAAVASFVDPRIMGNGMGKKWRNVCAALIMVWGAVWLY